MKGLNDFPEADRPPVAITFLSFRLMVGIGTLMPLLALFGWVMRNKLQNYPLYLKGMILAIPLPYIAIEAGWVLAEVGRQPWIVNGLMRTSDAVSPISTGEVGFTLVLMCLLYALLGAGRYLADDPPGQEGPRRQQPHPGLTCVSEVKEKTVWKI